VSGWERETKLEGGNTMSQVLISTLCGLLVGALFSFLKLPAPAPPNLAGVMGVVGVYLGLVLSKSLF